MTKKKKIVVISLSIFIWLLLFGGAYFLYEWIYFKISEGPDLSYENEFVKAEEFEVIEKLEGRFVKCEKYSLKVKVPENWTVKIYNGVALYDPNTDEDNLLESARQGACGMGVEIYENKKNSSESTTYADYLNKLIKSLENSGPREDSESREEVVLIDGNKGIKKTLFHEEKVSFVNIEMPINQTIYGFTSGFIGSEKCVDAFNSIMETVEINK